MLEYGYETETSSGTVRFETEEQAAEWFAEFEGNVSYWLVGTWANL